MLNRLRRTVFVKGGALRFLNVCSSVFFHICTRSYLAEKLQYNVSSANSCVHLGKRSHNVRLILFNFCTHCSWTQWLNITTFIILKFTKHMVIWILLSYIFLELKTCSLFHELIFRDIMDSYFLYVNQISYVSQSSQCSRWSRECVWANYNT